MVAQCKDRHGARPQVRFRPGLLGGHNVGTRPSVRRFIDLRRKIPGQRLSVSPGGMKPTTRLRRISFYPVRVGPSTRAWTSEMRIHASLNHGVKISGARAISACSAGGET